MSTGFAGPARGLKRRIAMSLKRGIVPIIFRRTEIPQSTVYNILRGVRRPSWDKAKKLAMATNQPPDFFMSLMDYTKDERLEKLFTLDLVPRPEWHMRLVRARQAAREPEAITPSPRFKDIGEAKL
jgi:transcriptional regulator with XRE-family HTH domain